MKVPIDWTKLSRILFFILLAVNVAYLDYRIFTIQESSLSIMQPSYMRNSFPVLDTTTANKNSINIDTKPFYEIITEATASLTERMVKLETVSTPSVKPMVVSSSTKVKEYYIPLGSGKIVSSEWVDVPGVEAYVVPDNYGKITGMYFEAGIRIPTGNGRVYARLKNVTDNTSLIESEMYREDTNTGLLSFGPLPLPSVTKLYRVQMKSTLGSEAVLDNARIKIFVE